MRDIDFVIIGAQKAGTTSLHEYLSANAQIYMPKNKELDYFSNERYYSKGNRYYWSFFADAPADAVIGEASPQYLYGNEAPARIKQDYPNMKIIASLRNPIDRAYSHYRMNVRKGTESRSFDDAVGSFIETCAVLPPELDYFGLGQYSRLLKEYYDLFPREQIHVLFSEELKSNRRSTIERLLQFLDVPLTIPDDLLEREFHQGGTLAYPRLSAMIRSGARLSPSVNKVIKSIIGTQRLYTLLHRFETGWGVSPEVAESMSAAARQKLRPFYVNDVDELERLIEQRVPWGDFSAF